MTSSPIFPDTTEAEWRTACERFLKGKDFDALVRHTEDGVTRGPLFTAADLPSHLSRLASVDAPNLDGRPWHVTVPVRNSDLDAANVQALENLKGGASAIRIEDSVPIERRADLERLLDGVFCDLCPIVFAPGNRNRDVADISLRTERLQTAHVCLGLDPSEVDDLSLYPDNWRALTVTSARIHEAGAGPVLELAVLAAETAEAFRKFGADAAPQLVTEIAADQDAHVGIAKTRSARRLVTRIADLFGGSTDIPLHAISSLRMMQAHDPWTDMLRVTNSVFGAVVGGADYILARLFTDALGPATPFSHRIARNTQLLMMEESHLGQVRDPAFGSYFHETLSERIAQEAWSLFQEIEGMGGLETFTTTGRLAERLDQDKAMRADDHIIGVTLHPRPDDVLLPEVGEA